MRNDFYGPITNRTVLIAVQVHKRKDYLRHLISSLEKVVGIHESVLIFSHDVWDEEINSVIRYKFFNLSPLIQFDVIET